MWSQNFSTTAPKWAKCCSIPLISRYARRHWASVQKPSTRRSCYLQPSRPVPPIIQVQQRKLQDILWATDAAPAVQEGWAANREQLFRAQIDGIEPNPIAAAMTDREIDILARKVDVMHRRRDLQLDLGIGFGKPREAADQPFSGKIR